MKKRYSELLIIMLILILAGCTNINTTSVCDGVPPEDSLICQKIGSPEKLSSGLLAANYAALKAEAYSKDAALKVVRELRSINEQGGITYLYFVEIMAEIIQEDEAAALVLIISPNIDLLAHPIAIKPFDQNLIDIHLTKQERLISLVKE